MRHRIGGNPIVNVKSLFMSTVTGRGVDWCRVGPTFGFDVNICDNINYTLPLSFFSSLSLPPSLLWRLKYVKVMWKESDSLQWQKKENDTAICWWYGDERDRRWKCTRRRQRAREREQCFWMSKYAVRLVYKCVSDSSYVPLYSEKQKVLHLKQPAKASGCRK